MSSFDVSTGIYIITSRSTQQNCVKQKSIRSGVRRKKEGGRENFNNDNQGEQETNDEGGGLMDVGNLRNIHNIINVVAHGHEEVKEQFAA